MEKRHLESWRHRVGRKEADRVSVAATTFGTRVHTIAQRIALNRSTKVEKDMVPFAEAIRGFLDAYVGQILETELSLVSPKERVGGTLDLFCKFKDGTYALVDYKTSAQLTREHGLQTALYALLLREHGFTVNRRVVVRVRKDVPGKFAVRIYKDHAGDVRAARACVELWHWQNCNRLKKLMEAA